MSPPAGPGASSNYVQRFFAEVKQSAAQLVRAPSHSRRAEAGRRAARHVLLTTAITASLIIVLMYLLDAAEIVWMPKRGTPGLWPVRVITDFGKSQYVLWALAGLLLVVLVVAPLLRGVARFVAFGLATRLQFLFLAVLVPVLIGEIIKWIVGRGRPFVGGEANAFNFSHFAGSEAYASFPSAHAIAAVALAFAVSALWPQARGAMIVYAVLIALSRLVLLAHHPSDVVAGALLGVIGALLVRYWFAARRLGFTIHGDGSIAALQGPTWAHLKGVARGPSAP